MTHLIPCCCAHTFLPSKSKWYKSHNIFRSPIKLHAKWFTISISTLKTQKEETTDDDDDIVKWCAPERPRSIGRMWSSPKKDNKTAQPRSSEMKKENVHDRSVYETIIKLNDDFGLIIKKDSFFFSVSERAQWGEHAPDAQAHTYRPGDTKFMSFRCRFRLWVFFAAGKLEQMTETERQCFNF